MKERVKRIGYIIGMWLAGRCEPPYQCYWGRRALEAEAKLKALKRLSEIERKIE